MKQYEITINYQSDAVYIDAENQEEAQKIVDENAEGWRMEDPAEIEDIEIKELKEEEKK